MWKKKGFLNKKKDTIKYFKKNGVSADSLGNYNMSGIPIIVVCEFIMEEMPEHTEFCENKIRSIKDFYGIKYSKNPAEEGCGTCKVACGEDHCITKDRK